MRVGGIKLEFPGRNRDTIGEEFKRKEARQQAEAQREAAPSHR